MGAAMLLALLAGVTNIGLELEETDQIALEDATDLTGALARSIEATCSARVIIDEPVWSTCAGDVRCLDGVRARTGGGEVVVLRVFGGLSLARVVAERFAVGATTAMRSERDVPRDRARWREPLDALAAELCPSRDVRSLEVPEPSATARTHEREEEIRWAPWIAAGTGVVLAGTGAIFGASSRAAREGSQNPALSDAAFETLADRTEAHAIVADALFGAAAIAVVTGVVLYLLDR